ncbi:flagellar hook-length control protein FliK [Aurantimonas sp. A3-2-R12]|uniref:flagellar hook-length control protein FliK n=1 Tax=Aurantimonas sp. A3-2-R12 TaxID=3114362 RepID=UPI002E17BF45|nr:flagellar hook-length control protein FliK [Aurantimonas sp. A3-2-R12]
MSKDGQDTHVDAKGHGDPSETEVETALAKLLGEFDQTKRAGTSLETPPSDQQKSEDVSPLTLLVNHALGTRSDSGRAHALAKPDGVPATAPDRAAHALAKPDGIPATDFDRAARALPKPDGAPTTALDRSNLMLKTVAVPHQAEVAVRLLGGSVDGHPNPARVDLVSMRTDFQPADTVALDGQVRSVGPALRASGFGRLLASTDAPVEMNRTDGAEASGDADGQEDGEATRLRGVSETGSADRNIRVSGKGGKGPPDGGMATATGAWGVDNSNADTAVFNDPAAGGRPSRQVASAVTSALADLRPAPGTAGDDGRLHLRAGGAALKTIQIQLQPEQLGKLDVTMRLVNGQLAIHLVASKAETALRLKDDAEGLKTLLSKAGFTVDEAAISIAVRDPATQRSPSASPSANAGTGSDGRPGDGSAENGRFEHRQSSREGREGGRESGSPASTPAASPIARRNLDPSTYL